ncbi:Gfo/Idh/MocA family oxidoreductase [Streptomyces jumonjinensis]|uniref:Dihydrodipicolinate reductase n=1 Tax=Streptomyces jumonjinensis TaxID=1945 RepID=A0A646KJR1_STRJU|nr:Gfo/Idh/MocA family oxidoreductase [Streptomyces jumonjinensis]MQT02495.1 dihydrodipicolinate reductase [Streptomyces jumonjinensis]
MSDIKESPRIAVCGVGAMGLDIIRVLHSRHANIVAGIVRPGSDKAGRHLGELAGVPGLAVPARADAERALSDARPDIVIVTVSTYLDDAQYEIFSSAVRAGANVITLAEEMLHPFATDNGLARELDALAKRHKVTVTGTGHQDAYWVNLISVLAGSTHDLGSVTGRLSWNVDDFGPTLAELQRVGTTAEEFTRWLGSAERRPTFTYYALHTLAEVIGLTPLGPAETTTEPVIAQRDTHCGVLGTTIRQGRLLGYVDTDVLYTKEGVRLSISSQGKVYEEGETDYNEWNLTDSDGNPTLHLRNSDVQSAHTTCATLVNRIPDVITARPGIVTIAELPQLRYWTGLHHA